MNGRKETLIVKNMNALKLAGLLALLALPVWAQDAKPLYENNFEQAEVGKLPEGFLGDGAFAVREEGGNKFLELPGEPLDTYGLVFGPAEKSNIAVSARVNGMAKGRRYPAFSVGLGGQGGYKLQVSPAKKALELYKGEEVVATMPFEWKSGEWTKLRLQIRQTGNVWKIEGKAWQGDTEPTQMLVTYDEKTEPNNGKASLWGMPFAGTPIQFDDLVVRKIPAGK